MRKIAAFAVCLAALSAAPAQAADPIKVGVILPYAPPFGLYAKSLELTMKMALEENGGKVAGREVKLIFENDGNKPPQAIAKARKLINGDKVDVLIGGLSSNLAIPIAPVAVRAKTPLIIINAGADMLTGKRCSIYVTRVSFSNDQFVRKSGPWIKSLGYNTAYLMAADYVGGRNILDSFAKAYKKAGGKVVGRGYIPFSAKDYGPYLAKAKAAKPDTIYVFFPGGMGIRYVVAYDKFGLKGKIPLTGTAWTVSPLFVDKQGKSAYGFKGPINYVPQLDNPVNKAYRAKYKAKTGREPDEVSVNGYDAINMLMLALKKVNGKTDDKVALIKALQTVKYDGPRGPMTIDPKTNNVVQNIYMIEVVDHDGKAAYKVLKTYKDVRDAPNGCNMN
jgi:branched-chain amino acid transport system substrate-binding protein